MRQAFTRSINAGFGLGDSLDWLAPLLMRIYFGCFWAETGWGKIHNLDAFTQKIRRMGHSVSALERRAFGLHGVDRGIPLMLGLFTRLASISLLFNMFVAVMTVKMKEVTGINDFAEMDEAL